MENNLLSLIDAAQQKNFFLLFSSKQAEKKIN